MLSFLTALTLACATPPRADTALAGATVVDRSGAGRAPADAPEAAAPRAAAGQATARAEPPRATPKEAIGDAWWTGPLLAASASTLPRGHAYVEPYVYDVRPFARFDGSGRAHGVPREDDFGSLTYLNYGLTDRVTVGLIPRFGYHRVSNGPSSSGVGVGDLSLQAQYRLTQFHTGSATPTVAVNLQETLPTGRFDRLSRPSDGFGQGVAVTTLSVFSQTYVWMPNGRILRARLNLSYAAAGSTEVQGASVYGTPAGFVGRAQSGDAAVGDLAFEYSATRHWVATLDLWYERDGSTRADGTVRPAGGAAPTSFSSVSARGRALILAPAAEYNWSARLGAIGGVRLVVLGRNATATVAPVAALSVLY